MILTKQFYTALVVTMSLLACKHTPKNAADKIDFENFVNKTLLTKIESLIDRQDSLADSNRIYSRHTSFWTYFYQKDEHCYVAVISNFEYYSSKNTNGYIIYKDKVITFYGRETHCGNDFIQWSKLKTDHINALTDYDEGDVIGPHEPFRREYLIVTQDSLKLVYEGY